MAGRTTLMRFWFFNHVFRSFEWELWNFPLLGQFPPIPPFFDSLQSILPKTFFKVSFYFILFYENGCKSITFSISRTRSICSWNKLSILSR